MWYQNIRSPSFSFVTIHASDGRTHRQTDRIATAIPWVALHAVALLKRSVKKVRIHKCGPLKGRNSVNTPANKIGPIELPYRKASDYYTVLQQSREAVGPINLAMQKGDVSKIKQIEQITTQSALYPGPYPIERVRPPPAKPECPAGFC